MKYQYEAMDKTGQEVRDQIEADGQEDAMTQIRHMGLFVTKISPVKSGPKPGVQYFRGQKTFFVHPLAKPFGIALAAVVALPVAYFFAVMMGALNDKHAAAFNEKPAVNQTPNVAEEVEATLLKYANRFEFEGHRYIRFGLYHPNTGDSVVHDPECPKCKKNGHN